MYIEFKLPQGAGGATAGHALYEIKREIELWANRYNIRYTQKTIKYTHRLAFDHDETYTLFSMTWSPESKHYWMNFQLLNIANERY